MKRVLLVVLVLFAVCGPVWAVQIAPGVDVTGVLTPATGGMETTVLRTITITNSNVGGIPTIIELGPMAGVVNGTPVEIGLQFTIPGTDGARDVNLSMPIPLYCRFVPGELYINNVRQDDPVILNGAYSRTVPVPAATSPTAKGVTIVRDRVDILVTSPTAALDAPLSMILGTTAAGDWAAAVTPVRARVGRGMPQNWYWWQPWNPPVDAENVIVRASVPPSVEYVPGHSHGYLVGQVGSADTVRGEYADQVVTWHLGDIRAGYPSEVLWFTEPASE